MEDSSLFHKLIERKEDGNGGSRLVAQADIAKSNSVVVSSKEGSIVCCSYPMVIAPVVSLLPYVCSYCYRQLNNMSRCSKCRIIRYCSKECQKADWRFHKLECQAIAAIAGIEENHPCDLTTLEILIVRMLRGIERNHNVQDFSAMPVKMNDHPYYRPITTKDMDLLLREYDVSLDQRQQADCFLNFMRSVLRVCTKVPETVIKQLFFAYKRFSVFVLREGQPIAEAMYPPLCEVEPSETPNLSCYFCNELLVLTASRNIRQGESLTFSFIPNSLPILYKTRLYMTRCMTPPVITASNYSPDLMGLKCTNGHPIPLSYSTVVAREKVQVCPACGERVPVRFLAETDRGVVFVPSLTEFEAALKKGCCYKEAAEKMEKLYDSDNYILYRCYVICRDHYINALDYMSAIPFCYHIVNYMKAYQSDQIVQLQNESIILADTLMRCGSIQDAICVLNDVIDLQLLKSVMRRRMERHSCFSPEEIEKVTELKKKWDMSLIMESYLKTD